MATATSTLLHRSRLLIFVILCSLTGLFFLLQCNYRIAMDSSTYVSKYINEDSYKNFEDKVFKRILQSFKNPAGFPKKTSFRMGKIPTILLVSYKRPNVWIPQLRHIRENECPHPCIVTQNEREAHKVDAIVFHLRDITKASVHKMIPKRDISQPWVMLSVEPPTIANGTQTWDLSVFNGFFNRTMNYKRDSDIQFSHGFIVSNKDATFLPKGWVIPKDNDTNEIINSKKGNVSVVALFSHCALYSGRLEYTKELQKYIPVDVYGLCGALKCGTSLYVQTRYRPNTDKCLRMFGTTYRFYLAFENSICKGYASERTYQLLYYPIIPVVLGGTNYRDAFPPHSYINAAEYTPSDLAKYLKYLIDHPKEYAEYFKWKKYFVVSTFGAERLFCDLCTKAYDPEFYEYKVYENLTKWFSMDADKCYRKWTIDHKYNLDYEDN